MTSLNMNNKFSVYLAKIEISSDGSRQFVRSEKPYIDIIWGTKYSAFLFKLRRAYFNKPNCNFNCHSGREFFCCNKCLYHCGYFEWEEVQFFSKAEKSRILSKWDNDTGFISKDGCSLPRELRSYVCLSFACRYSKTKE